MADLEQLEAIHLTGTNVVVSASAGAGKTHMLINRLAKRCIDDRIPLERILAMTFTKAAAGEMKNRLALELQNRYVESKDDPSLHTYIGTQLIALSNANICTIDSYCTSVIQKYYNVIGLDPASASNVLDGGTQTILEQTAFHEAFCELARKDSDMAARLASYFSPRSENFNALQEAVHAISLSAASQMNPAEYYDRMREKWNPARSLKEMDPEVLDAFYSFYLLKASRLKQSCRTMRTLGCNEPDYKPEQMQILEVRIENFLNSVKAHRYSAFRQELIDISLSKTPTLAKSNIKAYTDARKKLNEDTKALLELCYDESMLVNDVNAMSDFAHALVDLAQDTDRCYAAIKRSNTCLDFTDIERFVLDILTVNNGAVAEEIRNSFDEIMVDEFQDTSTLQNTIIEKISNGHNIFRVGDVKQSIYRFRQAKPSLMRDLMNDPEHQKIITLKHNYRSKQSIVEYCNLLFGKIMNVPGCKDVYRNDDAVTIGKDTQAQDSPVPVEFLLFRKEDGFSDTDTKAYGIAETILSMKEKNPSLSFKDFAVLVKSHERKRALRLAFDHYGIPYDIDTRSGFFNSDVCRVVASMIRFMMDEGDSISLTAALTSSFFGFTDEDLAGLVIRHRSLITGIREEHPEILELFRSLHNTADYEGIPAMLRRIQCTQNFYDRLRLHDQTNFDYLYDKACLLNSPDLFSFLQIMNAGIDEKSSEAHSISKDDDVVTVTTIHQSKGLQYKVVLLWSESQNSAGDNGNMVLNDELMLGLNYMDPTTRLVRRSVHNIAVSHASQLEDLEEFTRLLYVALTRAEERLLLVDIDGDEYHVQDPITISTLSLRKGTTGLILSALKDDDLFRIYHDIPLEHTQPYNGERAIHRTSALPRLSITPEYLPPLMTPSSTEVTQLPPLDTGSRKNGTGYGTLMHETIENLPDTVWTKDDLEGLAMNEGDVEKLLTFAGSEIYRECLDMDIHKEYSFFVVDKEKNDAITGSMDFVAFGKEKIILIDFKTDACTPDTIRNRYSEQLNTYRRALTLIRPDTPVEVYAYSFHNSSFIEI